MEATIMENQMEKKMENEMETGILYAMMMAINPQNNGHVTPNPFSFGYSKKVHVGSPYKKRSV